MPLQRLSLRISLSTLTLLIALILSLTASSMWAQPGSKDHPWSNSSLSPDERAAMVVKEMTLDEKITLLH